MAWPICETCGEREAWHRYTQRAGYRITIYRCCRCHIAKGGKPAAHHAGCQQEIAAKRKAA